jgi:hypothetical protein
MRHLAFGTVLSLGLVIGGCQGVIGASGPPVLSGDDSGHGGMDAGTTPGTDAGTTPGTDSGGGPRVDAYVAPAVDAYVGPDTYLPPDPTCTTGTPLTAPIAGCMPLTAASTGDPHVDCVARINQFRCECQHLPPLMRWTAGEACADMMAQYDHDHAGDPHAAFRAGICAGGYGQNECPGWPSVPACVSGCLQQMWDEGPGDFYGPPAHGHYINMSSTSFSMVACGFYEGSSGVYAVQNFQ